MGSSVHHTVRCPWAAICSGAVTGIGIASVLPAGWLALATHKKKTPGIPWSSVHSSCPWLSRSRSLAAAALHDLPPLSSSAGRHLFGIRHGRDDRRLRSRAAFVLHKKKNKKKKNFFSLSDTYHMAQGPLATGMIGPTGLPDESGFMPGRQSTLY